MVLDTENLLQIYQNLPVINRTYTYLYPSLALVNRELYVKLNSLEPSVVGVFLNDENFIDYQLINDEPVLFIVFNTRIQHMILESQLNFIRQQKEYLTEYSYCGREKFLILLIKTDKNIYLKFLEGKYSEMYTDEQIELTPFPVNRPSAIAIFKRLPVAKQVFAKLLNLTFDSTVTTEEIAEDAEYELPPIYSDSTRYFETISLT